MSSAMDSTMSAASGDVTSQGHASSLLRVTDEKLECRLETSFVPLEDQRAAWDEAVVRMNGSIYMSYDWARTWWEFYGHGKELRVFLFYVRGDIVGIVPVYIDPISLGPVRVRVARLVGSNIPPKVFDPPIQPSQGQGIFEHILVRLFQNDGCDALSFGPISDRQQTSAILQTTCTARADLVAKPRISSGVHSVFNLPATMEDYYQALSKNERKNRRKYELRLLKKEYETKVEIISDPKETGAEFDRFAEQHRNQWLAEGKTGHFGAWPRALEFNRALVGAHSALGRVRFIRIVANGQVIANQYTFAFGGAYYWELPAREVGGAWERFSLGPTGIVVMIEAGIHEGMARLEGGLAHYDYKIRLGAVEFPTKTTLLVARRSGSRFRMMLLNTLRLCLLYVYHKVWYRRLTPLFPKSLKRPQWMLWLRADI